MACEYEQWDAMTHRMKLCGAAGETVAIKGKCVCLCPLHTEFALDAINDYEVRLAKLNRKLRRDDIRVRIKQLQAELKES